MSLDRKIVKKIVYSWRNTEIWNKNLKSILKYNIVINVNSFVNIQLKYKIYRKTVTTIIFLSIRKESQTDFCVYHAQFFISKAPEKYLQIDILPSASLNFCHRLTKKLIPFGAWLRGLRKSLDRYHTAINDGLTREGKP